MSDAENAVYLSDMVKYYARYIEALDALADAGSVGALAGDEYESRHAGVLSDHDSESDLLDVLNDGGAYGITGTWTGFSKSSAELDSVELLLAGGGPTVRAVIGYDGATEVIGTWWFMEPITERILAPQLADYLFGLMGDA